MSNRQPKYKIGDQVQLKSGGPSMTINEAMRNHSTKDFLNEYKCQWFAGKKLDNGRFPEDSLEPYVASATDSVVKKK